MPGPLSFRERHDPRWWQATVARLEASGLPTAAFAAGVSVHPPTLAWWRSRLARKALAPADGTASAFVRVEVAPAPVMSRRVVVEAAVGPLVVRVFADAHTAWAGTMLGARAQRARRC